MHVNYNVNIILPLTILLQWMKLGMKKSVFVCLAAQLDGTKLKPIIVFGAAKTELKSLHDEHK